GGLEHRRLIGHREEPLEFAAQRLVFAREARDVLAAPLELAAGRAELAAEALELAAELGEGFRPRRFARARLGDALVERAARRGARDVSALGLLVVPAEQHQTIVPVKPRRFVRMATTPGSSPPTRRR